MDLEEWKQRNAEARCYAHFDRKAKLNNDVLSYITNPENVSKHGFYPFIHYKKNLTKYSRQSGKEDKSRDLYYAAHIDRYIYSYYAYLINEKYNPYLAAHGLDGVAIAYRNDLHKSNIEFAKEAVDFMRKCGQCFVMVGDFSKFFDNIDHAYLKDRLCKVLGVDLLQQDYYAVFKNVTKYSKWELLDLLDINGLENTRKGVRVLNSRDRVLTPGAFRKNKAVYLTKHEEGYGIPQGSPISAVLANVYMVDIDERINDLVLAHGGKYMRYSDDTIIIVPDVQEDEFMALHDEVCKIIATVEHLQLEKRKTKVYEFEHGHVRCSESGRKNVIDYLGFSFDGKEVTLRDKTISKYYCRLYRKAKQIAACGGRTQKGNKVSCKNLYAKCSIKGAYLLKDNERRGIFITYVDRAQKIFKNEPINRCTKRHMLKVRRVLDTIKSDSN